MVCLIMTVFNERQQIELWFKSFLAQSRYPEQVVIVDGGSNDGTFEFLKNAKFPLSVEISVISDPSCSKRETYGPIARGRNVAIAHSEFDRIISIDAGCIMHPQYIQSMCDSFNAGHDYICGCYDVPPDANSYQLLLRSSFIPDFQSARLGPRFLPSSRSFAFTKSLWKAVGGYSENAFAGEDTKFASDTLSHSVSPFINRSAIVFWESPRNRKELKDKCFNYGFGDGVFRQNIRAYIFRSILLAAPPLWLLFTIYKRRSLESFFIHLYQVTGFFKGILK